MAPRLSAICALFCGVVCAASGPHGTGRAEDGVKVLFLGSAASRSKGDLVHLVTRGIESNTGRRADVRVRNMDDFERDFASWRTSPEIDGLVAFVEATRMW